MPAGPVWPFPWEIDLSIHATASNDGGFPQPFVRYFWPIGVAAGGAVANVTKVHRPLVTERPGLSRAWRQTASCGITGGNGGCESGLATSD
jgi:hypothetical protein